MIFALNLGHCAFWLVLFLFSYSVFSAKESRAACVMDTYLPSHPSYAWSNVMPLI